jgi:hypothetical protein
MRALGIVFVLATCAAGCTAILGDFTIGSGPAKGDGGADGSADVNADSPPPQQLVCAVGPKRASIGQFLAGQNGNVNAHIFYFAVGDNKMARVLYDDNNGNVVATTVDTEMMTAVGQSIIEPGRLLAATQTPKGIAALIEDNQTRDVFVRTLPTGAPKWDQVNTTNQLGKSGEFQGACIREASMLVTDVDTLALITVATDMNCQTPSQLRAFGTNPAREVGWDLMPLGGTAAVDGARMAVDGDTLYAMVSPNGNGGPMPGSSPFVFTAHRTDLNPIGPPIKLPLLRPSTDVEAIGAMVNAQEPGKANLMMIAGDISMGSGELGLFVGKSDLSALRTFTPQNDLPKTVVSSVSQMPVNRGEIRWHNAGSRQDVLAVSTIVPNPTAVPGINFWWFDDKGNVLAKQAGLMDALFRDEPTIAGLSVDFLAPPAIITNVGIAYIAPTKGGKPNEYDVTTGLIVCGSGK